ncbi:MAG: threonyl-tRNA synthetase editing domain-containing protein [Acidilobaceae archaeon]
MRVLYIHASRISYKTVEEAIENPPDPPGTGEYSNCLIVFTTIEEGDDDSVIWRASGDIVSHANRLSVNCILLYPYAHLSSSIAKPSDAYRLLRVLEEALRGVWSGVLARAPFGWYKSFDISCIGHPLSELSREFRREETVSYMGVSLEEALAKGILEEWLLSRNPWSKDLLDLSRRFDIDGLMGRTMLWELENKVIKELNLTRIVRVEKPKIVYGLWGLSNLARLCSESESSQTLLTWGYMGDSMAISNVNPASLLESINKRLVEDTVRVKLGVDGLNTGIPEGIALIYKARNGGGVPLIIEARVRGEERYCLGPIKSILLALLDSGLKDADTGVTPQIPPWTAPIQVAILPVTSREVEVASRIAKKLEGAGIRVKILAEGSLGSRIREAGMLWVPIVGVIGSREAETNTISVRMRKDPGRQEVMSIDDFIEEARRALAIQ